MRLLNTTAPAFFESCHSGLESSPNMFSRRRLLPVLVAVSTLAFLLCVWFWLTRTHHVEANAPLSVSAADIELPPTASDSAARDSSGAAPLRYTPFLNDRSLIALGGDFAAFNPPSTPSAAPGLTDTKSDPIDSRAAFSNVLEQTRAGIAPTEPGQNLNAPMWIPRPSTTGSGAGPSFGDGTSAAAATGSAAPHKPRGSVEDESGSSLAPTDQGAMAPSLTTEGENTNGPQKESQRGGQISEKNENVQPVPEPASLMLLGIGIGSGYIAKRMQRKRREQR